MAMATTPHAEARPSPSVTGFDRVLVATDLLLDGDRALRRAGLLPLNPNARILVTHVLPARIERPIEAMVCGAAERELLGAASKLGRELEAAGRTDVTVEVHLARGGPSPEIVRVAELHQADLLCVGRRRRPRLRELVLGSTARSLVRSAGCPVLVVGSVPGRAYEHVLVAFDLSDDAFAAARLARRIGAAPGGVSVVHAVEDPHRGIPPTVAPAPDPGVTLGLEDRAEAVRSALEPLWFGSPSWPVAVTMGDPSAVILEAAGRGRVDLIAMGTAGRTGLDRALIGSVAETVLDHATSDVLIVRRGVRRGRPTWPAPNTGEPS
jgi:nucleotide-binding universal stress UspA family protein